MRDAKPPGLGPEYGEQFQDECVAAAYPCRPRYPEAVFDVLDDLALDVPRRALDLGAGTGDLARRLARRFEHVDAIDVSPAMIALGQTLPGGDAASLHWRVAPAESPPPAAPYGLVTAGESLHWMDWERVFPVLRNALAPGAFLALVGRDERAPWNAALREVVPRYSTNTDYAPYVLLDEVVGRGLFRHVGTRTVPPTPIRQTVDAYLESMHSRNGFSRERMGAARAAAFDGEVAELLRPHAFGGVVELSVGAVLHWGTPTSAAA